MTHDINNLEIIPYIIAERAIYNILDRKLPALTPSECWEMCQANTDYLVQRAEHLYKENDHFRESLHRPMADQRYTLEMWMEHWFSALLVKNKLIPAI